MDLMYFSVSANIYIFIEKPREKCFQNYESLILKKKIASQRFCWEALSFDAIQSAGKRLQIRNLRPGASV